MDRTHTTSYAFDDRHIQLNDLIMLLFLRGLERTEAEWHSLCDRAGLRMARLVLTQSHLHVIECVSQ